MYEDIINQFKINYFSLHTHTIKSINDSILKIEDLIDKAKKLNLKALSITNHGVMNDVFDFYNQCKENNIKPILGCEVYICKDRYNKSTEDNEYSHLVLIAKNKKGFENLLIIHNDAKINGFYVKPRTDINMLKEHSEGLICLTACVGGELPKLILKAIKEEDINSQNNLKKEIIDYINTYKNIFNDFYLEIQPGTFPEQIIVNTALIELSKETNTPYVVTNDVHYLDKEDYKAHNIHVLAGKGKEVVDNQIYYPDKCYYVMSNEDLIERLNKYLNKENIVTAVNNIYNIVNSIEEYDLIADKIYMPIIDIPEGYSEYSYMQELCFKRLNELSDEIDDISIYTERLLYEIETLKDLRFCGYFLVVRDYLKWCDNNHIMRGPGRGSCVGSLVAYLLDIVKIDPIKYGLLFDRFISKKRASTPDIDCDIDANKRHLLFSYVVNKYGKDKCCLVSTFTNRKSKLAIKDTGRVFNIPDEIFNHVADLIPSVYYFDDEDGGTEKKTDISIKEALEIVPELKEYQEQYPEWFNAAIKLSDIPKATSLHAAGTIISPIPLENKIPLTRSNNEDILATELNLEDAELVKLIKFDFLSLSTLGVIDKILKMINKSNLDFIDTKYNDEKVWKLIGSSNTAGLFQIGTPTYRQRMGRLHPKNIEELAACLALVRGPCISSKLDEKYIRILNGEEEIELIHSIYDSVCKETQGILIYQEQLMKICCNVGFSISDSYDIMKSSAKKKHDKLLSYEKEFMKLASKKHIDELIAKRIFKMIVDSGKYSFNKSHAVAYAVLVYYTAYLRVYYPREFLAAALSNAYERKEEVKDLINICRKLGYKFLLPDINKSEWNFTLENDKDIRIGFCAIKSFGYTAYEEIKEKRPFTSMQDLLDRVVKSKYGKRAIIPSILTGCFSSFYDNRYDAYLDYCELSKNEIEEKIRIQGSKDFIEPNNDEITLEKAYLGYPLVSNPLNKLEPINIDLIAINKSFHIKGIINKVKKIKDKNKNDMAFICLDTGDGSIEVTLFANNYKNNKSYLKKNLLCDFYLRKTKNGLNINSIELTSI